MGRRWWAGPSLFTEWAAARPGSSSFQRIRRDSALPIKASECGPRPCPPRQIIKECGPRPGLAHRISKTLPARPIAARLTRHGLNVGWSAISVGQPVDLKGRPTDRSMCYPRTSRCMLTFFFFNTPGTWCTYAMMICSRVRPFA